MELTNRQNFGLQQVLQQPENWRANAAAPSPFTNLEPVPFAFCCCAPFT